LDLANCYNSDREECQALKHLLDSAGVAQDLSPQQKLDRMLREYKHLPEPTTEEVEMGLR
jgi:hypothetical protein